jgi:hypothetical protein
VAGIYNVLLGGQDRPVADERAASEFLTLIPDAVSAAYQNRNFLVRVVPYLAARAGIRQFIDIGMGFPARRNVHDLAREVAPDTRVLYVDSDPEVVARAKTQFAGASGVAVIHGDLRDPDGILAHSLLRTHINLDEPIAVLLVAVLHFVEDHEGPHRVVRTLREAAASGSYLALSHATGDELPPEVVVRACELFRNAAGPLIPRPLPDILRFLDDMEIIQPGVVNGSSWRPGHRVAESRRTLFYAAAAKKL